MGSEGVLGDVEMAVDQLLRCRVTGLDQLQQLSMLIPRYLNIGRKNKVGNPHEPFGNAPQLVEHPLQGLSSTRLQEKPVESAMGLKKQVEAAGDVKSFEAGKRFSGRPELVGGDGIEAAGDYLRLKQPAGVVHLIEQLQGYRGSHRAALGFGLDEAFSFQSPQCLPYRDVGDPESLLNLSDSDAFTRFDLAREQELAQAVSHLINEGGASDMFDGIGHCHRTSAFLQPDRKGEPTLQFWTTCA
jgi:hypothetical protein